MNPSESSYGCHRHDRSVQGVRVTLTSHAPHQITPVHSHPFGCLHYVIDGLYLERSGADLVGCGAGEIVTKSRDIAHSNGLGPVSATTLRLEWHDREPPWAETRLRSFLLAEDGRRSVFRRLARAVWTGQSAETIQNLIDQVERTWGPSRDHEPVECRAASSVLRSPELPMSVGDIALSLGVHRSHLARQFRRRFGCTLSQFVRRQRALWVAREMLKTHQSLVSLALGAGFHDQSHCNRAFRTVFGKSPGRWRPA